MSETHRILVAESIVQSRLSLTDLLNPAYGSESEYDPAADESSDDDEAIADPTQTHVSEGTPNDAMTVGDPDAMDIDHTDRSSMDLTTSIIADASDHSSQAESQMSIEQDALTFESEMSLGLVHDLLDGSKTGLKKTRQTSLASFFHSSSSSTSRKRDAPLLDDSDDVLKEKHGNDSRKRLRSEEKSKSAIASWVLREKFRAGKLEVDVKQLKVWQNKILEEDPGAEFDEKNTFSARHSKCGAFVNVKEPFNVTQFCAHIKNCTDSSRKWRPAARMPSLLKLGWNKGKLGKSVEGKTVKDPPKETYPCPGLTELDDARIPVYLKRTGFVGGGARSLAVIAKDKFNKVFSKLGLKKKKEVMDLQLHEHLWRNEHEKCCMFATKCKHVVAELAPNECALPCNVCDGLLSNKRFKAILRKPVPEDKNFIYTNHRYRSKTLGEIYARTIGL